MLSTIRVLGFPQGVRVSGRGWLLVMQLMSQPDPGIWQPSKRMDSP